MCFLHSVLLRENPSILFLVLCRDLFFVFQALNLPLFFHALILLQDVTKEEDDGAACSKHQRETLQIWKIELLPVDCRRSGGRARCVVLGTQERESSGTKNPTKNMNLGMLKNKIKFKKSSLGQRVSV